MSFLYRTIFLSLICFFIITSCNEGCNSQLTPNRQVKLTFAKKTGGTIFPDSTVTSVYIYNKDTFFYEGLSALKVSLELDLNNDSTMFFLKTDSLKSKIVDTLIFSYKRELVLLSSECGFNTSFLNLKIKKYSTNKIDSIISINQDVNADVPANFKIVMKKDTTKI